MNPHFNLNSQDPGNRSIQKHFHTPKTINQYLDTIEIDQDDNKTAKKQKLKGDDPTQPKILSYFFPGEGFRPHHIEENYVERPNNAGSKSTDALLSEASSNSSNKMRERRLVDWNQRAGSKSTDIRKSSMSVRANIAKIDHISKTDNKQYSDNTDIDDKLDYSFQFSSDHPYSGHILDPGSLDYGYPSNTAEEQEKSTVELKSNVPVFNVRQYISAESNQDGTDTVKSKNSNNSIFQSNSLLPSLSSSSSFNSHVYENTGHAGHRISDMIKEVSIDSLLSQLLRIPLSTYLNEEEWNNVSVRDQDRATSPRIRFLSESQYIDNYETLLLLEVASAIQNHILTLKLSPLKLTITSNRNFDYYSHTPYSAGKSKHFRDFKSTELIFTEIYCSAAGNRDGTDDADLDTGAKLLSDSGGRLREVTLSAEVDEDNYEKSKGFTSVSNGNGNGTSSKHNSAESLPQKAINPTRIERYDLQMDDLVLLVRPSSIIEGKEITLSDISCNRHIIGVVVSSVADHRISCSQKYDPGTLKILVMTPPRTAHQPDTNSTYAIPSSTMSNIYSLTPKVIDKLQSTYISVKPGSKFLIATLMNLSTFMREWSALHSCRDHRLMPLTPYILKASPVISAIRLDEINMKILGRIKTIDNLRNVAYVASSHTHQARLNDAYAGLDDEIKYLDTVQIDGSVLQKTSIVQTLSQSKSNPHLECVRNSVSNLLKKWKSQIKVDNKVSTIQNMKGGNVMVAPSQTEQVTCPLGVPNLLWTKLCESYNSSQLFAIKYVSDRMDSTQDTRIALVQGPPGTGKTSTILGMVSALLHRSSTQMASPTSAGCKSSPNSSSLMEMNTGDVQEVSRNRLLLCAPSNAAVDVLLERIMQGLIGSNGLKRTVKIIRMGDPPEGCPSYIRELSLEYQTEKIVRSSSLHVNHQAINERIQRIYASLKDYAVTISTTSTIERTVTNSITTTRVEPKISKQATTALEMTSKKQKELRLELISLKKDHWTILAALDRYRADVRRDLIYGAEIVATTLSSSGKQIFLDHIMRDNLRFETTLIDEAAQATEVATLIPLRYGCIRLVLVGDPRQLPATVLSQEAERRGLGVSLFERLEKAGHPLVMLTVQYRMHPEIRLFPSNCFYQGKLLDHPSVRLIGNSDSQNDSEVQNALKSSILPPIKFYSIKSNEIKTGKSFRNPDEENYIVLLLKQLSSSVPNIHVLSVGVISPYKGQVSAIKNRLQREISESHSGITEFNKFLASIEVNSVDGFQGKEKDIIFFSCVRTSTHGIGFLGDDRRINVAITRAKRSLLLVGRIEALQTNLTWNALFQSLQGRGCIERVTWVP